MLEKSLLSEYYLSSEIFEKEREKIFSREWVCAGRAADLPEPGEFRVLEILGESLLVARTADGRLAAHDNVCRHRGARLCAADGGGELAAPQVIAGPDGPPPGTIRCSYHSWTYSLDGKLAGPSYLKQDPSLRIEELSLHPCGIGEWGGFFFLNLWPAGPRGRDFASALGPVPEGVRREPIENLRTERRVVDEVAANWKVVVESFHRGDVLYPNLLLSAAPELVVSLRLLPEAPDRTRIFCDFLFHPAEMEKPGFDPSGAVAFRNLVHRRDWAICEEVQRGLSSRATRFDGEPPREGASRGLQRYVLERLG